MESNDYVSVEHLLSEITQTLNDSDYRNGFAKGWYISRIQDALQELAFDTFYQKLTADFDFPTDNFSLEMPKNCFNIREIYLYNGGCCTPSQSAVVYWKRLGNNNGKGPGYTARVKKSSETNLNDPFQPSYRNGGYPFYGNNLYWANVMDGKIMFGGDCTGYTKVRIVYNGMGGLIGDKPVVPRFFERAINDYVEERYYNAMKSRDPRLYSSLWSQAYQKLNDVVNGSWTKSKTRVKMMSSFERESMSEYISNILHK